MLILTPLEQIPAQPSTSFSVDCHRGQYKLDITLHTVPSPLQTTTCDFSVERVVEPMDHARDAFLPQRIWFYSDGMHLEWASDTSFQLADNGALGIIASGRLEFRSTMSGLGGLNFVFSESTHNYPPWHFPICWVIDESGELLYLDNGFSRFLDSLPPNTIFFEPNRPIEYIRHFPRLSREMFDYKISFDTTPRIGDSSLFSLEVFPRTPNIIVDHMDIRAVGWLISDASQLRARQSAEQSQVFESYIEPLPIATNLVLRITLHYSRQNGVDQDEGDRQSIVINSVFMDSGELRLINSGGRLGDLTEILPKSFRQYNGSADRTVKSVLNSALIKE